ncbi:hypothetical protein DL771_003649 [Monosporascus sp. 5C6A]|nr:hypothetical protein DL771_003649 [Monosporascus sp. 5C6A]
MQDHAESHCVPYFRYFGPTAIVPGFKRMVVSVRDRRRIGGFGGSPHQSENEQRHIGELPIYNPNDPSPVPRLILQLVDTFFLHLGCNYRFLREGKFKRMVEAKTVEPILVDAVCATAARFSDHPSFDSGLDDKPEKSEYGQFYAGRAKSLTVDTFACPSVAAVQACLLMAYESFGASLDSALWMYVGLANRMAVDLGLQTFDGVRYQKEKDLWDRRTHNHKGNDGGSNESWQSTDNDTLSPEEQMEAEQERVDTLWAVFMLDRVVSSSTGRPVTFRDDDFELPLPPSTIDPATGWPDPSSTLIRIIHLYGRVSDVLNKIRDANDLTQEKMSKLAQMENDLTQLYRKQDPRLRFDANNFQKYVKQRQGTTFILFHFWFHALIIILHQPTLLTPFGSLSRRRQLKPHSRELSMSSAKTIADILAFAGLVDPKIYIGNPFTSQPIYIAACAFLMESVADRPGPASPEITPPPASKLEPSKTPHSKSNSSGDAKTSRHFLLASAANQNYQLCYKSLQQLREYWGGVKYILTALDQKSKGIWDCETYTKEEYESAKFPRRVSLTRVSRLEDPSSPNVPPFGWSLTGTTNSPNSSLTLLYQNVSTGTPHPTPIQQPSPAGASAVTPPRNMIWDPIRRSLPETPALFPPPYPQPNVSAVRYSAHPSKAHRLPTSSIPTNQSPGKSFLGYETLPPEDINPNMLGSDGKLQMLTGLGQGNHQSPPPPAHSYTTSSHHSSNYEPSIIRDAAQDNTVDSAPSQQHDNASSACNANTGGYPYEFTQSGLASGSHSYLGPAGSITDAITFDSQEIDIGALGLPIEMMPPWLEYLPGDVMGLFDGTLSGGNNQQMG